MKFFKLFPIAAFMFFLVPAMAQTEAPKGYSKGSITLPDSTVITGYIKDNLKKDAVVTLQDEKTGDKKTYHAADIIAAEIESNHYSCIKGDFFKVICNGELAFLQKSSDASSKPSYNGSEAIFISGTAGKPGDYFIYNNNSKQLELVSKKTFNVIINSAFTGCTAAIDKAKATQGDIAQLKDAVELFNNRNSR